MSIIVSARPPPLSLNFSRKAPYNNHQLPQGQDEGIGRCSSQESLHEKTEASVRQSRNSIRRSLSEPFICDQAEDPTQTSAVAGSAGRKGLPTQSSSSRLRRSISDRRAKKAVQNSGRDARKQEGQLRGESRTNGDNQDESGEPRDPSLERRGSRLSASFSRFSRYSWISPSRSPSPGRRRLGGFRPETPGPTLTRRKSHAAVSADPCQPNSSVPSDSKRELLDKDSAHEVSRDTKRLSALVTMEADDNDSSPLPPVPKLPSTTRSSSPSSSYASSERPPTFPKSMSFERLQSNGLEKSRKRDELWSTFRTLENEFHK